MNEVLEKRNLESTGMRASHTAVALDIQHTIETIRELVSNPSPFCWLSNASGQMLYLQQRTGVLSFAVFARSSLDDHFPVEYVDTGSVLERFLPFLLPNMTPLSLVQSFDLWCSSHANCKSMLSPCLLLADSLFV